MIRGYWQVSRRAWDWSVQAYEDNPEARREFQRHLRWSVAAATREARSSEWFSFLDSPEIRPFVEANPRLAFRPMGSYLSTRWSWARRAKVIRETYEFIQAQGGALAKAMTDPAGMVLIHLPVGREDEARVRLGFDSQFRKEGEISAFLELRSIEGPVSSFAFSLERRPGLGWSCRIGSLQGRKGGDEEAIKAATKALHGLRPKMLMVYLAQEIARALRVGELLGVGNDIQIFRSRILRPRKKVLFDYDALWLEVGGSPGEDGWFALPLKTRRRSGDEIKPNKRALYAKRYALMAELSRQVKTVLSPF